MDMLIPKRLRASHRLHQRALLVHPEKRPTGNAYEWTGLHKDGREIALEISQERMRADDGFEIMFSIVDISERKKSEARIKESQNQFQAMADAMPVIVFRTADEHGCTYINKEAAEYFGMPAEQLLGFHWLNVIHPDERAKCEQTFADLFASRKAGTVEFRGRRFDGEYRWFLTVCRPFFGDDASFRGYIGTAIDITDSKQAQYEIHKTQMELSHARRVSSVGELASSLAHELNQPLSAILSNAQAALRFMKSDLVSTREIEDILGDIVSDDKRAGMIIRRLRGFVKQKELETELLNLNDVAQGVIELLHSMIIERGARVATEFAHHLPVIRADLVQLQQVLLNLLVNGLDAMRETPQEQRMVSIRTIVVDSETVQISVKDSGPGLSEDRIERVFQPFFTTKKEGLGMGLSIARTIIEAHKGRLWAENNPEGGAVFHITLPINHG